MSHHRRLWVRLITWGIVSPVVFVLGIITGVKLL